MKSAVRAAIVGLGMACAVAVLPVVPAHAFAIYFVVNTNDAGIGSLRDAIEDANADAGANDLQNYPTITSAVTAGGLTTIAWDLDSLGGATFRIEFFASNSCDGSGNGEGRKYMDTTTAVTVAATGLATGITATANTAGVGQVVVATATLVPAAGLFGPTSEFSACVVVT